MTQKNELIKKIADRLKSISTRLESYKKVDATLSDETLIETDFFLGLAEEVLENGFVQDACDEIDEMLNVS